jgi:type IV pilus assembly protein PilN
MTRINLLPWRAIRRRESNSRFYRLMAVSLAMTLTILLVIQLVISTLDNQQSGRNRYLTAARDEIALTARKADDLKQDIQATRTLVDRLSALEQFRTESVLIMHELAEATPPEVYLTELQQARDKLTLLGLARSEEQVSRFLHAIEASPLLSRPELVTLENTLHDNGVAYTRKFTIQVYAGSHNNPQQPPGHG